MHHCSQIIQVFRQIIVQGTLIKLHFLHIIDKLRLLKFEEVTKIEEARLIAFDQFILLDPIFRDAWAGTKNGEDYRRQRGQ